MDNQYPFPSYIDIAKFIGKSLDLKQSSEFIQNKTLDRIFDPRGLRKMMDTQLYSPVEKYLGITTGEIFRSWITGMISHYRSIVAEYPVELLSKADIVEIICSSHFLHDNLMSLAHLLNREFSGANPADLFALNKRSVSIALHWIETHEPNWTDFKNMLEKSDLDLLSSWRRGDVLPSAQAMYRIFQHAENSEYLTKDGERIRTQLFFARAIDFLRGHDTTAGLVETMGMKLSGIESYVSADNLYEAKRKSSFKKYEHDIFEIDRLDTLLNPELKKHNSELIRNDIDALRVRITSGEIHNHLSYIVDWIDARWHISAGDLAAASSLYKSAFNNCLFIAGHMQKKIMHQSLVVFASLEKPDKVMLKHIKWSLINYGYEDVASLREPEASNKYCENVDEWEIMYWKSDFNRIFPVIGFFDGKNPIVTSREVGPLLIDENNLPVPDLRNPNRRIKVGSTWKLQFPQIAWFAKIGDIDAVKKLIEKRANVNVYSASGDTPLCLSLDELNITDVPKKSLNDELFWLLCEQKHLEDTVNCRSQKKRLLPIIAAVDSGRKDIVAKVLSLGADVNMRGLSSDTSALFHCIELIAQFKSTNNLLDVFRSLPATQAVLNSFRLHSQGLFGFSADHMSQALNNFTQEKNNRKIFDTIAKSSTQQLRRHTTVDELRAIAMILIDAGADPNSQHMPYGHSSLMLTAELDEIELFDRMVEMGGDPAKSFVHPEHNQKINCFMIAEHFKAIRVKHSLAQLKSH